MTATSKTRVVRLSSALKLDKSETVHVGVDVHKASYHVAVLSNQRGFITHWTQPADPQVLLDRLKPIHNQVAQVVYEAGPTGFTLVRRLRASGFHAEVIAPSKIPSVPGPETKCDRLDCRKLATFAQKGLLQPVRVPTEPEEADRQVVRLREQLVRKLRTIQQQIKGFLMQHGIAEPAGLAQWSKTAVATLKGLPLSPQLRFCLDVMLDERQHAQEQVARVTRHLDEMSQTQIHQATAARLRTVPGVGLITAMTFRVELHDPARFAEGGQVARMIGLAPQIHQSGSTRHEGRLLKTGNARLRTVLVEAAWRWVARDPTAANRYRRLVGSTGSSKKAIVGMARRLAILLWRLSLGDEPYRAAA
jgi:transposase